MYFGIIPVELKRTHFLLPEGLVQLNVLFWAAVSGLFPVGGARQTRFLYHVRRQAAEMSRSPCTQPCCSNLITRETKCTPLPQHAFLKILFSRIKFAGVILFQISISPTFMFRKVYRRCTKWITNSQNRRRATTQSRKSPVQSLKMPPKPAEQSDNNKMHGNARDLALSQITAPPAEVMDPYEAFLKYTKEQAQPSLTNDAVSIVVKSTKRQRDAHKSFPSDEHSIPESSDIPKKRKTSVNENLALPTISGTSLQAPHTPPGDITPKLQIDVSKFAPFTPDSTSDVKQKAKSKIQSDASGTVATARTNQIHGFKVSMRSRLIVQPNLAQPTATDATAQEAIDLAEGHKKANNFHGAETEFLRAFEMYTRTKGPDSPHVFRTMNSLAEIYEDQTRPSEAPRRRRNCYVFCG